MPESSQVPLPAITEHNKAFWTGGADGHLMINRCQKCSLYIHPPLPMCPTCHSRDVKEEAVSGDAVVASFSINHMQWMPDLPVPYAVAIVELVEQAGLYLTTKIINSDVLSVQIDMPVSVVFEKKEDIYLPFFQPKEKAG